VIERQDARKTDGTESAADEKVGAIGAPPARLDDFRGISNRAGDDEGPRD
jgi:hypothetical protein